MKNFLLALIVAVSCSLPAQSFVNGSFEITTAPLGCNYNLGNTTFNSYMSSVVGYGPGQELDILANGCYNPAIPDGVRAVGIAAWPSDELSIPVTPSLVAGQTYSFTFRAYAELSFRVRGDIQIGVSNSSTSFGSLIYTGVTVSSAWTLFTVTFTSPINATHVTVRNAQDGIIHWNHVDDFRFTSVLPVHIQQFDATREDREARLDWLTQMEQNSDHFKVERSSDGSKWSGVGVVSAAGNSNLEQSYSFTDLNPLPGMNYYRLGQTDMNGSVTYSEVKMLDFGNQEGLQLQVFPNPAREWIQIEVDEPQKIASISLTDASGKLLYKTQSYLPGFDIQSYPQGFYLLGVELTDGRKISRKVMKAN
jgi:hypothetical protein